MGLFGKLNTKSSGAIALDESQQGQFLFRYPLKNNELKVDQIIKVSDGYHFVACYYNKVCDCLLTGDYKFNSAYMPLLFKNLKPKKTKKGLKTPKSLFADVYYFDCKNGYKIEYKTPFKIKSLHKGKPIKIRLEGSFKISLDDCKTFLKAMLMDYGCIDEKKAFLEIADMIAYAMCDLSNRNVFTIEEYNADNEEILKKYTELAEKELLAIGLHIAEFKITNVVLPKGVDTSTFGVTKKKVELDDIYKYLEEGKEKPEEQKQEVFVNVEKESSAEATAPNVINLGFGGGVTTTNTNTEQTTNSTVDEYEKATKAFNEDFATKRQQNLVFLANQGKEQQPAPPAPEQQPVAHTPEQKTEKSDIMLGRGAIGTIDALGPVEIADDFVQKNRKVELEELKKIVAAPAEEITKRPKVLKEGQEAKVEKRCKGCGATYTIKDKFCPKCGKSTLSVRYCKACGEANDDSALLCKMCGSRMN